jgi:hypothetical protein
MSSAAQTPERPNKNRRQTIAFACVAAILAVGAIGLNASAKFLKLRFQKEAVELQQPIASVPEQLGPWLQVSIDTRMPPEIENELGTLDYIERVYIDTRKVPAGLMQRWEEARSNPNASADELLQLRGEIQQAAVTADPYAAVRLHVAYYTGKVDTVPHIPDRCMLGGGFEMMNRSTASFPALPGEEELQVSFAQYQQGQGGRQTGTISVAYFFEVNGDYEHDAITGVRKRLQNLFESHAYFAKIEVGTTTPGDAIEPAQEAMSDFLLHALPGLDTVLPDWDQVVASAEAE